MNNQIKNEKIVLLNFLKSNTTTRQLDELLKHDSKKSRGWKSWKILKKYKIESKDRGRLFCFREQECLNIIKEIIFLKNRSEIEEAFNKIHPKHLENYRNTYIIADDNSKVYNVLNGEIRNITQSFFSPLKKLTGKCQYTNCNNTNLDTVHLIKNRPEIFMLACEFGRILNTKKYDVYKIMRQYIQLHSKKKSICFLCKKHHQELTIFEKSKGKELNEFKRKIESGL